MLSRCTTRLINQLYTNPENSNYLRLRLLTLISLTVRKVMRVTVIVAMFATVMVMVFESGKLMTYGVTVNNNHLITAPVTVLEMETMIVATWRYIGCKEMKLL